MKRILLICLVASAIGANAQLPFPTIDSVYVNKINASVLVHGDMWWNPTNQTAHCYFPANSRKSINFASAIWMSGYDAGNNLHVAAQTYRQSGNDYWPGPLDASDTLTYATSHDWAKIWKVNRSEIQYFQTLTAPTTTSTPQSILTWPGKGNMYALGNAGIPLTITDDMAPFVDLNSNGIYEPLLGEYPDVKGEQALWWVFSDNGPSHSVTNGKPLGVEIHAMAYGYSRGTLIDNVIYYDYSIINKSANDYHNFRVGLWDDTEIGYYLDNDIGFDSTWRMGITYKATNDDGGSAGHPPNSYGLNPPQSAITMIVLPGDVGASYVPVGSFDYYNNDFSVIGNPSNDTQCNNYMRSKMRNGTHFTNTFTGPGTPCLTQGSGPNTNYVFTGDPSDSDGWSECRCLDNPGDRRWLLSSNDFTFNSGTTQKVVFALIVADSAGGCSKASFDTIRIVADTAWKIYHNPLPPRPASVPVNKESCLISIYPNPAHDKLFIENSGIIINEESINVYNTLGQQLHLNANKNGPKTELDINLLPDGLYLVRYRNGMAETTMKFMKE